MSQRAKIIAHAWSDEQFKMRLLNKPVAMLAKHGIKISTKINVKIIEDTSDTYHFVLPVRPAKAAGLSGQELVKLAEQYVPKQDPDTIPVM